jgi:hypothetical protein
MEKLTGGACRINGRQILEEQGILDGSDHIQICCCSIGVQARRSATGGSQDRPACTECLFIGLLEN